MQPFTAEVEPSGRMLPSSRGCSSETKPSQKTDPAGGGAWPLTARRMARWAAESTADLSPRVLLRRAFSLPPAKQRASSGEAVPGDRRVEAVPFPARDGDRRGRRGHPHLGSDDARNAGLPGLQAALPGLPSASAMALKAMQETRQDALSGPRAASLPPAVPSLSPPALPSRIPAALETASAQSSQCHLVNNGTPLPMANGSCTGHKQLPIRTIHVLAQPGNRANNWTSLPRNAVQSVAAPTLSQQTSLELRAVHSVAAPTLSQQTSLELRPASQASLTQVRPAQYILSRRLVAQSAPRVVSTPTFSVASGACGSTSSAAQVSDSQAALVEARSTSSVAQVSDGQAALLEARSDISVAQVSDGQAALLEARSVMAEEGVSVAADLEVQVQQASVSESASELPQTSPDMEEESVKAADDLEERIRQVCDLESRVRKLVKKRAGLKALTLASRAAELREARRALSDTLRDGIVSNGIDSSLSPCTPSPLPGRPRIAWTGDGLVTAESNEVTSACMVNTTSVDVIETNTVCGHATQAASTVSRTGDGLVDAESNQVTSACMAGATPVGVIETAAVCGPAAQTASTLSWNDKSTSSVARASATVGQQLAAQTSVIETDTVCGPAAQAASALPWNEKSTSGVAQASATAGQQLATQLSNHPRWSWSSPMAVVSVETSAPCPRTLPPAGMLPLTPEIQLHSKPVSPSSVVFRSRSPSLALSGTSAPSPSLLSEMQVVSPYRPLERARPAALDEHLVSPPSCMAPRMGTRSSSPCRSMTPTQVLSSLQSPQPNLISRPVSPSSMVWATTGPPCLLSPQSPHPCLLSPQSPQTWSTAAHSALPSSSLHGSIPSLASPCSAVHADPAFSLQAVSPPIWHQHQHLHPSLQQQSAQQQWQQQQQQQQTELLQAELLQTELLREEQEREQEREREREREERQRLRPRWVWQGTWVRLEPQEGMTEGATAPALAPAIAQATASALELKKELLGPQETSYPDRENQDSNVREGARLLSEGASAYLAAIEAGATAAAKLGRSCRAHSSAAASEAIRRDPDLAEAEKAAARAALRFLRGLPARGVPLPHEVMSCLRSAKRARASLPSRGMLLGLQEYEAVLGPPSLAEAVPLF